jgi:hypothetical protein
MALLAAETVLLVLLGSLVVGSGADLTATSACARVVTLHFLLDTNVEDIGFLGVETSTTSF